MKRIAYVYAVVATDPAAIVGTLPEGVDGSSGFRVAEGAGRFAIYSEVDADVFSQESIDAHAADLSWLGTIGLRHEAVNEAIAEAVAAIPMRAFTLFSTAQSIRQFLEGNAAHLDTILARISGRAEWTIRVEFDAQPWGEALVRRVESLRILQREAAAASAGRAYLLKKKLEDARSKAAREAEQSVVAEIESAFRTALDCPAIIETRTQKSGSFPQINLLVKREDEAMLQEVHRRQTERYGTEGVTLVLTGPWPPYSFTRGGDE